MKTAPSLDMFNGRSIYVLFLQGHQKPLFRKTQCLDFRVLIVDFFLGILHSFSKTAIFQNVPVALTLFTSLQPNILQNLFFLMDVLLGIIATYLKLFETTFLQNTYKVVFQNLAE